ncbi:MAG TPA: UPF0182 family protein [Gemmatimonadales bacterium]|nr:UPF0182 family protein [Gemmatimonadales bacterium]
MSPARRRWAWAVAAGVVVTLLVGGRWAAIETAERLWAATIPGGETYLDGRALARLFRVAVLLLAVAWATANLHLVYLTIGSVQLPRRLGDLEIVEAVSRRVLLAGTVASGLVFGLVLTWGTGDWWLAALLAGDPPRVGTVDPVLHRDLGYYLSSLRWNAALQNHLLTAVASVTTVVTLLYAGIGVVRWRRGSLAVSPRARLHLGVLLAALAAVLAWGAALDPAEVVGGLHRAPGGAGLAARIRGAGVVSGIAAVTVLASVVWGWTGRTPVLAATWGVLLTAMPIAYWLVPGAAGGRDAVSPDTARATVVLGLTERAFGLRTRHEGLPHFATAGAAVRATPLWDGDRVATRLRHERVFGAAATVAMVRLDPGADPTWIVAPAPDEFALRDTVPRPGWTEVHRGAWSTTGPPLLVRETGAGLTAAPVALRDTLGLYGPGFAQYAVRPGVTGRRGGIALTGAWRRAALAWTLQSPELWAREVIGDVLLWRRDAHERFTRLAPFATFDPPVPVVADSALWWVSYGYVDSPAFPLVTPVPWRGGRARYLQAGFVGAVSAADGDTRLFLAPGHDSLSAAWGRQFAPLVLPVDSLPAALRAALPPPAAAFAAALEAAQRAAGDTGWVRRPGTAVETVAPALGTPDRPALWRVQGFEAGTPARLVALFAGTMTWAGPVYVLWRPDSAFRAPPPVLGSRQTKAGVLRMWPAGGAALSVQAVFDQPERVPAPAALARVYVTWRDRVGEGVGPAAAWADLEAFPGGPGGPGAMPADLWDRARQLLARADSALGAGDLERFGRVYAELHRLFGLEPGQLAPAERPQ